jgi:leucine dehydrogenase
VFHAIRAAVRAVYGSDLSGRTVAIQGVGHVGSALAALLADDGAKVLAADTDPERAISVADSVGGVALSAEEVVTYPADVFAPCAVARVITTANINDVGARIVAGAANDVLASRGCAALLRDRGVTYVPDFVANGGGVIHIHSKRAGWTPEDFGAALAAIGTRVSDILDRSARGGVTPLESAEQLASERIGRSVRLPD